MPPRLLIDENISPVVSDQVRRHRPEIEIESVHKWRGGAFKSKKDEPLLIAAASEGWTLITYDRSTIPPLLTRLSEEGKHHAGVIYVDQLTVASKNYGLLVTAPLGINSCGFRTPQGGFAVQPHGFLQDIDRGVRIPI